MFDHPLNLVNNVHFNGAIYLFIYLIQCTLDKLNRTANNKLLCNDL